MHTGTCALGRGQSTSEPTFQPSDPDHLLNIWTQTLCVSGNLVIIYSMFFLELICSAVSRIKFSSFLATWLLTICFWKKSMSKANWSSYTWGKWRSVHTCYCKTANDYLTLILPAGMVYAIQTLWKNWAHATRNYTKVQRSTSLGKAEIMDWCMPQISQNKLIL